MLFVSEIKEKIKINNSKYNNTFNLKNINNLRSKIPSVTHVDNTSRIQTVSRDLNKIFYELIANLKKLLAVLLL